MSTILYVSDNPNQPDFGADYDVWHAREMNEALGMYVFYMPDVIVLDGSSVITRLVYEHLTEVSGKSPHQMEAMLVLNAGDCVWDAPEATVLRQQTHMPEDDVLHQLIADLLEQRQNILASRYMDGMLTDAR